MTNIKTMTNIKIITNNKPRQLIYGYELSDKQKQDFDYIEDIDSHDFVKYKNNIYDLSEFMRIENNESLKDWEGYSSDSFFSGTLVKYIDSDTVIMGWYYS